MLAEIHSLLPGHPWKDNIHWFDCVESTNTLAKQMAEEGAPHGTVLIADRQTAGRGRQGRSFLSPAGSGIYMSVILRPQVSATLLMHLTCAVACAACDAVEEAVGFRPNIKWTNDLVYQKRKLAGVLTELSFHQSHKSAYAVIGIGINCCQTEADFDPEIRSIAGSLQMVTGKEISRSAVAAALIQSIYRMDETLLTHKARIMAQYRKDCMTIGQDISVVRLDEVRHGHAIDIDDKGALLVQFPDGHMETVNSGEVSVRGMYGYV